MVVFGIDKGRGGGGGGAATADDKAKEHVRPIDCRFVEPGGRL